MQIVNLKLGKLSASKQRAILLSIYHNIYTATNTIVVDYFTVFEEIIPTIPFSKVGEHYYPHFQAGQQGIDKVKALFLERARHIKEENRCQTEYSNTAK